MTAEQLNLGITPDEPPKPRFDVDEIARHIGEHAPEDPYSSYNRRKNAIAERKAATYTPETLPPHLLPVTEDVEAHFAATAPGKTEDADSTQKETVDPEAEIAAMREILPTPGQRIDKKHLTSIYQHRRGVH